MVTIPNVSMVPRKIEMRKTGRIKMMSEIPGLRGHTVDILLEQEFW